MLFRIPILVRQMKAGYSAKPLFHEEPTRHDDNLNRLYTKFTRDLIQRFEILAKVSRHDALAQWTFSPSALVQRHDIEIELRRRKVKLRILLVVVKHLERKLAFCPNIPDVWFEVSRGEKLASRAQDVLQDHWRKQERDTENEEEVQPETANLIGKAWVHTLEFHANTNVAIPKEEKNPFRFLGGMEAPDGSAELRRVGRCLDWLYPEELERALLREREVAELWKLFQAHDKRPILLVGPRQCGKTAIIHECVYRRLAERPLEKKNRGGQTWLLSPQRLISGMSYVGQWEGRLLAILKNAIKRDHTLYFDDLLGLLQAGVTSQSTLNAATVMKPYLEDQRVRILAEIAPEQLRVLRERDRGFADLFHIVPIREPNEVDTFRLLVSIQRRLEGKHRVNFALDALPTVIDLQRRYERVAAFPGKAAVVFSRLAVRASKQEIPKEERKINFDNPFVDRPMIQRNDVLEDAVAQTGLSLTFLDPVKRLDRDEIRQKLAGQVIGQDEAVDALADVVSIAKARLNDPNRPLASFLFLGPTGVGKTETAKAAARILFGDAERLIRFDLNEFNQPGAAARLVGTFQQPEGLLTVAVRRQPFCVLLLDEVEKAHPDVHDLLLQVLGEGRLTDSLGRTADFTNAIILLTSNLGVREAESVPGLVPVLNNSTAFTRAAERFFRPEFFNRLDRVIPFRKLTREEMGRIAQRLVSEVLAREGFAQRQCVLSVAPEALESVIDAGYDPALGARAMKRTVERELTKPAAARLATISPDRLTIVTIRAAGKELSLDIATPEWAACIESDSDRSTPERLASCREVFDHLTEQIATLRPKQAIVSKRVTSEQERYFALKELADAIAAQIEIYEEKHDRFRDLNYEGIQPDAIGKRSRYRRYRPVNNYLRKMTHNWEQPFSSILSALTLEEGLEDIYQLSEPLPGDSELFDLENRLALLQLMASTPSDDRPVYLWLRALPTAAPEHLKWVASSLLEAWKSELGVEVMESTPADFSMRATDRILELRGIHARALAATEVGTHLIFPKHGGPQPLRIAVSDSMKDPFTGEFLPILRIYPEGKPIVDLRSGLISAPPYAPELFRTFTLAALPRA